MNMQIAIDYALDLPDDELSAISWRTFMGRTTHSGSFTKTGRLSGTRSLCLAAYWISICWQLSLHIQLSPSHSQVSSSRLPPASKPPYNTTRFRTGSYPSADPPRAEGELTGWSSSQIPSFNTQVAFVSEANVESVVAPPKMCTVFASFATVMPKWERLPGPGTSICSQVLFFHAQNSSEIVSA